MMFKTLAFVAALQLYCHAIPFQSGCHSPQTVMSGRAPLTTTDYFTLKGTHDPVCWKWSDNSGASYLSIACGDNGAKVRFCSEPECINQEEIQPGRFYYMLSDADGRKDEFACVREGHGYGVGLSKGSCRAEEDGSLFSLRPAGEDSFVLFNAGYGEQKPDFPWITKNGHGLLPLIVN